ncbi:MAG: hypothetical protein JWQ66_1233 [Mucilaginibacter sp.]|nr:hypothetical protein [Mucilaginibacter sp.]
MPISIWQKNLSQIIKIAYYSVRKVNSNNDRLAEFEVKAERIKVKGLLYRCSVAATHTTPVRPLLCNCAGRTSSTYTGDKPCPFQRRRTS